MRRGLLAFPALQRDARQWLMVSRMAPSSMGDARASSSIPEDLLHHLRATPENNFIDLWKEHLMPLIVDSDGPVNEKSLSSGLCKITDFGEGRETADPWEFIALKVETAYKLLASVLGQSL